MLTLRNAAITSGISASRLLLLALMDQIPSCKDPETRLILFDPKTLRDWTKGLWKRQ